WKANNNKKEITAQDLAPHIQAFRRLRVKHVLISGGEPLMHSNLWTMCEQLKTFGARITLLSTGILLKRHAKDILRHCDEVIVSLDGSRTVHNEIRGMPSAFEALEEGLAAIRALDSNYRLSARCVIQRRNFSDLVNTVQTAKLLPLNRI